MQVLATFEGCIFDVAYLVGEDDVFQTLLAHVGGVAGTSAEGVCRDAVCRIDIARIGMGTVFPDIVGDACS